MFHAIAILNFEIRIPQFAVVFPLTSRISKDSALPHKKNRDQRHRSSPLQESSSFSIVQRTIPFVFSIYHDNERAKIILNR
jgi:hypothetical protein